MDKKTVRKHIRSKREALDENTVKKASEAIADIFFERCLNKKDNAFLLYSDFRNEVMTKTIIDKLLSCGKKVYLPIVRGDDIVIGEYGEASLKTGAYGIYEPENASGAEACDIDVFVVPGIAFDKKGGRIGFGKGYYDRLLAKARPDSKKIALAYEMQIVDDAYSEEFDFRMDAIVTEKEFYEVVK